MPSFGRISRPSRWSGRSRFTWHLARASRSASAGCASRWSSFGCAGRRWVTAAAAPVCEEIFFRGMLFRLLESRTALWLAVLGSALAFGAAHASPAVSLALLPTFVYMGVVLALLYVRTGWLTNTILLHSLNNAVVTIVAF